MRFFSASPSFCFGHRNSPSAFSSSMPPSLDFTRPPTSAAHASRGLAAFAVTAPPRRSTITAATIFSMLGSPTCSCNSAGLSGCYYIIIAAFFKCLWITLYSPSDGVWSPVRPQSCYHICMTGKWVGVLAIAAVLGFVSYYETLSVQSQPQSPIARTQLAAAPTGGDVGSLAPPAPKVEPDVADKMCPPRDQKNVYAYDGPWDQDFKVGNTTYHNLYGKKCEGPYVKAFCSASNVCDGKMKGSTCFNGKEWGECKETKNNIQLAAGTSDVQSDQSLFGKDTTNKVAGAAPTQELTAKETARTSARPVVNPFDNQTPPATTQQPQQQGPTSIAQIRAEAERSGSFPVQTGQQTFPTQTQTQPSGSAFEQGGVYRAGGTNPSGGLTGGTRPSYFSPSRAQNTFGGTGLSSSRSGSRVASSFISGFASLIGGLFSVPANNVVNYVQSFVGGSPQQTPANENGWQQQTYAPGQVVIVAPYPMPTSRTPVGGQLTQLPPPPTSTPDAYAELRALARQANATTGSPAQTGGQEDRITSAFSGQEGDTRQGTVPAGNQNASGESRATPAAGRQGGLSQSAEQSGATSVPGEKATSTHATSTSYKEPRVVEGGNPVDITDHGSYETVSSLLKGDGATTSRTA